MPQKVRQLLADLRRAGYEELPRRGKGSHRVWAHPLVPDLQPLSAWDEAERAWRSRRSD